MNISFTINLSFDEQRAFWEASGVHAYLVKKYGIEKVCNMCMGGE